jgi:putative ABC transport system permease protein
MKFILNMARREMRGSWRRLLVFFGCIAIGVAAMVSVRSFTERLADATASEARALFSADVRVDTANPAQPNLRPLLQRFTSSPRVIDYTEIIETQTMVRPVGATEVRPVLVELRGVQRQFPLHGRVHLVSGTPFSHTLLANEGAIVSPNLLSRMGIAVGDRVQIGTLTFVIRGAADRIPGNALNFSPIPRVLIEYDAVARAGVTTFGSRVRYIWLFKTTPDGDRPLLREMGGEFRAQKLSLSLSNFRGVQDWLANSFAKMEGFTGLIGISMLVLGGVGVASVTRVFIQQKVETIAILKCVGGRNTPVLGAYLVQSLALGAAGAALGLLLAFLVNAAGTRYVERWSPLDLTPGLTWRASLEGLAIAGSVTLLFALPPLLEIRQVKPFLLFRRDTELRRFDRVQFAARLLVPVGVLALAVWQAGTFPSARSFIGTVAVTAVALNLAGSVLIKVLSRAGRVRSLPVRYAIGNLCRPGNQTKAVLFAVGIGTLFLVSVRQQQVNFRTAYSDDLSTLSADMFAIDIQPDQRAATETAFSSLGARDARLIPVVRTRIVGLKWGPAKHRGTPQEALKRAVGERRVSYTATRNSSDTIVAGRFWDPTASPHAEVSIEEDSAHFMMVEVGDTITFEIAGRRIDATVTSLRKLERRTRQLSWLTRFEILFRPGTLESAPHMFAAAARGPAAGPERARLQNAFLESFPNVTLVDALDDITEIRERIARTSSAVSVLGAFVYLCGVLILVGSIGVTRGRRIYEAAILKTLGARRLVLAKIAMIEFAVLGLVAGLIGSTASIALTWSLMSFGRSRTPWLFSPAVNVTGILGTVALVTIVGVLSTWSVLMKKPLGTLREQ